MKQDEREPLPVEEQVVIIYAVSNGYLDEIEANNVPDWESQFRGYMRDSHDEILQSIRDEQKLTEENEESLKEAIQNFNRNYEPEDTGVSISMGVGEGQEDEEEEAG